MTQEALLTILIKAVVLVFVVVTAFAYLTLLERKLIGRMQARYGPNRVGVASRATSPHRARSRIRMTTRSASS